VEALGSQVLIQAVACEDSEYTKYYRLNSLLPETLVFTVNPDKWFKGHTDNSRLEGITALEAAQLSKPCWTRPRRQDNWRWANRPRRGWLKKL
jgi:hypothetical protein